jgi:hypothetical protein
MTCGITGAHVRTNDRTVVLMPPRVTLTPMRQSPGALLVCIPIVACSSPSSGGSQPDTVQAVCQTRCDRELRCEPDASSPPRISICVDRCEATAPAAGVLKTSVMSEMADCFVSLPCDRSDDTCTTQVIAAQNPNWRQDPEFNACLAKSAECLASGGGSFSDDNCVAVFLTTDSVRAAFNACVAGACGSIAGCIPPNLVW